MKVVVFRCRLELWKMFVPEANPGLSSHLGFEQIPTSLEDA